MDRRLQLRWLHARGRERRAGEHVEVLLRAGELVHPDRTGLDAGRELRGDADRLRAAEVEPAERTAAGPLQHGVLREDVREPLDVEAHDGDERREPPAWDGAFGDGAWRRQDPFCELRDPDALLPLAGVG